MMNVNYTKKHSKIKGDQTMILKKIINDGKEVFERIPFEDAIKLKKDELVFTSEDDEEKYDDYFDALNDEREENDEEDELEDEFSDLEEEFKDFGEEDIRTQFDILKDSKSLKLAFLLPFLSDEKIKAIAQGKLNGDEKYKDLKLAVLLPFMPTKDVDKLFMDFLKDETKKKELFQFAPFISEDTLDYLCDQYCDGKFSFVDINKFYPFMSDASINKLFEYFLKNK